MSILTVALPLYKSKYIAWAAMESLVRQVGIDFEWELLVAEEIGVDAFGEDRITEYTSKLRGINCKRIEYFDLENWISLAQKWRLLAQNASSDSIGFVLQAGDCYSNKNRLKMTFDAMMAGADWVQMPNHLYYDIMSGRMYVADREKWVAAGATHPCGADMAGRTELVKKLPDVSRPRSVDIWMYNCCKKIKGAPLNVYWDKSNNWQYSINIHGLNNISDRENWWSRSYMIKVDWTKNIPSDILSRLVECKKIASKWRRAIDVSSMQKKRQRRMDKMKSQSTIKSQIVKKPRVKQAAVKARKQIVVKPRVKQAVVKSRVRPKISRIKAR
jgi:hypothetical protein